MQLNLLNNYRASKSFLCVSVLNAFACSALQFAFSIINHVPTITNVNSKTICCVFMAFTGEAVAPGEGRPLDLWMARDNPSDRNMSHNARRRDSAMCGCNLISSRLDGVDGWGIKTFNYWITRISKHFESEKRSACLDLKQKLQLQLEHQEDEANFLWTARPAALVFRVRNWRCRLATVIGGGRV